MYTSKKRSNIQFSFEDLQLGQNVLIINHISTGWSKLF